jgi:F-type H+-transporting ATPase subunit 8
MPQLVPFYFLNEVFFAFTILTIIAYVLAKYILPRFVRLFLSRIFIKKLSS